MALLEAQLMTLKTDITVTKAAVVYQGETLLNWWNAGADGTIAEFYNQPAVPAVPLWKPRVPVNDLITALVGSEFKALPIATQNLWFVLTQGDAVDATLSRTRQNFIDVFGAAAQTTANLTAVAQKAATYFEALFATVAAGPGTGSISPVFGQMLTADEVWAARSV